MALRLASFVDTLPLATAVSPVRRVDSVRGSVLRADIYTNSYRRKAYLKFMPIETIAKEALCWALARTLGLPVLQAYYVALHPGDIEDFSENPGNFPGNSKNLAFGLEEADISLNRVENRRVVEARIGAWKHALACGIFDEWIVNSDRIPHNLLFAGENNFILIDHDDALPAYASAEIHSTSDILRKLSEGTNEFEQHALLRDADQLLKEIRNIDFQQILKMVLHENVPEIDHTIFSQHIEFLRQRARVLPDIVSQGVRSEQIGFMLDDEIREEKERYR